MLKVIKTLKCDFHIHTVFSDGKVWPDIRVAEAWQEGLDAIAITDHIEYRPFDWSKNNNLAFMANTDIHVKYASLMINKQQ